MRYARTAAVLLVFSWLPNSARADVSRTIDHVEIDGVRIPRGDIVEIAGPCIEIDDRVFYYTGWAEVRALRFNGLGNQDEIRCTLFTSKSSPKSLREELKALKPGKYYKLRGRLMDAIVAGSRNVATVVVEKLESIPDSPLGFADFVGRSATFEGRAASGGILETIEEVSHVDGVAEWPKSVAGKQITVRGVIRGEPKAWRIEQPSWNLLNLEDQVDQNVSLVGYLRSRNDDWCFEYRDQTVYLTSPLGPPMKLPGDAYRGKVCVTGKLVRQLRPSREWNTKTSDDFVPTFVVRGAKVQHLDGPLTPDMHFSSIYATLHSVSDGVPELLKESCFVKAYVTPESNTRYYAARNTEVMEAILRVPKKETLDVLARRMNDAKLPEQLRLIYAAMLARVNDERGRSFLINSVEAHDKETFPDALYCLGEFPSLTSEPTETQAELQWAEPILISLMTNQRPANLKTHPDDFFAETIAKFTIAEAAVEYSDIPGVLTRINSPVARKVLIDYVTAQRHHFASVVQALFRGTVLVPVDDLLKLDSSMKDLRDRRDILNQLLRHKHPSAVARFAKDLGDVFVYSDFRDNSSPEVLAALRPVADNLPDEARYHAEMLIVLAEKDPFPSILAMLDDAHWKDKSNALWELSRLEDPRCIAPVVKILREAPADYFDNDYGIGSALHAMAKAKSPEAVRELIELLSVDLSRFKNHNYDRKGYQNIVARHLIELTGESFGTDVNAWREWQRSLPKK